MGAARYRWGHGVKPKMHYTRFLVTSRRRLCLCLIVHVADLLRGSRQPVTDFVRGNWCNGFWPLAAENVNWRLWNKLGPRQCV